MYTLGDFILMEKIYLMYRDYLVGTILEENGETRFILEENGETRFTSQYTPSVPEISLMDEMRQIIERFKNEVDVDTDEQNKVAQDLINAFSEAEKVLYEEEDI